MHLWDCQIPACCIFGTGSPLTWAVGNLHSALSVLVPFSAPPKELLLETSCLWALNKKSSMLSVVQDSLSMARRCSVASGCSSPRMSRWRDDTCTWLGGAGFICFLCVTQTAQKSGFPHSPLLQSSCSSVPHARRSPFAPLCRMVPIPVPLSYSRIMPFLSWQPLVVHSCHCRRETKAYLLFPLAENKLILPSLVGLTMKSHRARLTFFFQLTGTLFAPSVSSHLQSLTSYRLSGCQPAREGDWEGGTTAIPHWVQEQLWLGFDFPIKYDFLICK